MRGSDIVKNNAFANSHDKQIYSSKHDEIVLWLYQNLKEKKYISGLIGKNEELISSVEVKIEAAISKGTKQYRRIIGFSDLLATVEFDDPVTIGKYSSSILYLNFEVKSSVNIGETIRQIRYYDTHDLNLWFVCAPPFIHSGVLNEQNIGFIEYTP